jgi:hypothetical protein
MAKKLRCSGVRKMPAMMLAGVLFSQSVVCAQPGTHLDPWTTLQNLGTGSRVRLVYTDGAEVVVSLRGGSTDRLLFTEGTEVVGRIVQVTGDEVTINSVEDNRFVPGNTDRLTFSRSSISAVSHLKFPSWAKWTLWGSLIGFGVLIVSAVYVGYTGQ